MYGVDRQRPVFDKKNSASPVESLPQIDKKQGSIGLADLYY